jgi:toxin ParE1/3/4
MVGRAHGALAPGVRSFPFGRYVVFYMPLDDGIDVVRVLHGARDIDAAFNPGQ